MANKKSKIKITTPIGRVSYPYLAEPDTGREYSNGKYSINLLFDKGKFEVEGKELRDGILKVAREYHDKPSAKLSDFRNPLKDLAKNDKCPEVKKGFVALTAKTTTAPIVIGPDKKELSKDEIKQLVKEGCYARIVVTIAGYPQMPAGVTAFLGLVQYVRPGESFGEGGGNLKDMVDEIEVTPDSIDDDDVEVTSF